MTFFFGPGIGNNSQVPEHLPALVILGAAAVDHVLEALRAHRVVSAGAGWIGVWPASSGAEVGLDRQASACLAFEVVLGLLAAAASAAVSDDRHRLFPTAGLDPIGRDERDVERVGLAVEWSVHGTRPRLPQPMQPS